MMGYRQAVVVGAVLGLLVLGGPAAPVDQVADAASPQVAVNAGCTVTAKYLPSNTKLVIAYAGQWAVAASVPVGKTSVTFFHPTPTNCLGITKVLRQSTSLVYYTLLPFSWTYYPTWRVWAPSAVPVAPGG